MRILQLSIEPKITVGTPLWHTLQACEFEPTGWKPIPLIFRSMLNDNFKALARCSRRWFAIVAICLAPANHLFAQRTLAIRGATIETASELGALENATLLIRDGKIEAIGSDVKIPVSAQIVNATGKTITPGFVDPYFVVTIGRTAQITESRTIVFNGRVITIGGGAPSIATAFAKVADGLDLSSVNWHPACRSGITTFHIVASGYAQSLIAQSLIAQSLVAQSFFDPSSITQPTGDSKGGVDVGVQEANGKVLIAVSNDTKSLDVLRTNLKPVESRGGVRSGLNGGPSGGAPPPSRAGSNSAPSSGPPPGGPTEGSASNAATISSTASLWSAIRDGKSPVFVNVNNASAILHADAILAEYPKAKIALIASGSNVFSTLEMLDGKRYTVILSPTIDRKPNTAERVNVAKLLSEKDVGFVFSLSLGRSDFLVHQPTPLFGPAMLVRAGLDRQTALKALTIGPAKLLGIEKEVGSLEIGKQANFVVFDTDPFSVTAGIEQVYISGVPIHD